MNPANYSVISFPSLGVSVNPGRYFSIGPLTVHYYGLVIAIGLVLAVLYLSKRSREFSMTEDELLDGVMWVTPFAILCARLYYVVFSWDQYAADPISALYIWNGGLAIYGGVLGAIVGILVFCRVRRLKPTDVLDLVSMGFLIGQSVGRWGNFFNREAFGAPTESFFRMGLYNELTGATDFVHPTFLYESVWNLLGFVIIARLSKKRKYSGQVALEYVLWYGFGRTMIEGLRMDSLYWGPFRVSQMLAAISCLTAAVILLWNYLRSAKK